MHFYLPRKIPDDYTSHGRVQQKASYLLSIWETIKMLVKKRKNEIKYCYQTDKKREINDKKHLSWGHIDKIFGLILLFQ